MTRPHESPDCRCEGCASWDYSESRKDACVTTRANVREFRGAPELPPLAPHLIACIPKAPYAAAMLAAVALPRDAIDPVAPFGFRWVTESFVSEVDARTLLDGLVSPEEDGWRPTGYAARFDLAPPPKGFRVLAHVGGAEGFVEVDLVEES